MDVNIRSEYDESTPLHILSAHNEPSLVKYILTRADPDVELVNSNGWTALHQAARHGHAEIVQMLIKLGKANVNSRNRYGATPLVLAGSKR